MSTTQALTGKTVFITGAAGGIGAATARVLHRRGANVVLTDLEQRAVDAVAGELGRRGALPLAVDVTDAAGLQAAVAAAVGEFGALDVVFANAGIAADPPTSVATVETPKTRTPQPRLTERAMAWAAQKSRTTSGSAR
jgi:NAD(P)-dependent dehydrogenase (short-subunit alcohol dehydrogenase family)